MSGFPNFYNVEYLSERLAAVCKERDELKRMLKSIVRCEDCVHWEEIKHGKGWCSGFAPSDVFTDFDHSCSSGERRKDG